MVDLSHYSGGVLDRASELRGDDAWIAATLGDPGTRFVPVRHGCNLLRGRSAVCFPAAQAGNLLDDSRLEPIFLGIDEQGPLFAIDVSHVEERELAVHVHGCSFEELYGVATQLMRREASLLSHAAWLVRWRRLHRYCGACGHATEAREAGHVRLCTNSACGLLAFPRIDPAVIMITEYDDRCLLARQKDWPGRMHSCLAGFVEPGESAEEAVVREIREESGLETIDVRFHATQPWPYPCSLMLGFFAVANNDTLTLDTNELAEARWFSRADLNAPDLDIDLPRSDSIARGLIDTWIASA